MPCGQGVLRILPRQQLLRRPQGAHEGIRPGSRASRVVLSLEPCFEPANLSLAGASASYLKRVILGSESATARAPLSTYTAMSRCRYGDFVMI